MSEVMKSTFDKMYTFKSLMRGCEKVLDGVQEDQFFETLKNRTLKIQKNPKAEDSTFLTI